MSYLLVGGGGGGVPPHVLKFVTSTPSLRKHSNILAIKRHNNI
jgi:hypothetical protein